ncbi:BTB/POZ and MATH domain-containing protein 1-like [Panicum virgatum]|uniref:BTB/POZ and MATH domain-containing protein 1-like n=1 Tax=Panicum virgatum TaxID=38727 RepID=UPI0019D66CFD|nr:BTB/POZ and MATH domain-containing protein 1-like [Panicum virgatum]
MVDGYSKFVEAGRIIASNLFLAGGHDMFIEVEGIPCRQVKEVITVNLCLGCPADEVKAMCKLTLLSRAGGIISSTQRFYTFSETDYYNKTEEMNISALLEDSFQIRCEVTVVKEITEARPPDLPRHLGGLLASQVAADATFQVGGELFAAHRCVLAVRSAVFMAELFGPGKVEIAAAAAPVRIDDVEPRVFQALLHFVYTDSFPEEEGGRFCVDEDDYDYDDKVAMARGLLAAADRFGVERLKLTCGDVLCNYIDARTAMDLRSILYSQYYG